VSDRRLAWSGQRVPATVPATPGRAPDSRSDPACGWCATIPSDFAVVSSMPRRLANWARTTGLSSAAADDLALASYEALVNSAEHAYQRRLGYIQLTAQRTNDHVIITVTDHGRWPDRTRQPWPRAAPDAPARR
jgi:anti-sigma regulatory factor (Ser/Thr protein kinase)